MLLYDQDKAGHILNGLHAAAAEVNAEDFSAWHRLSGQIHNTTAFLIFAVSLYIKHAIEAGLCNVDLDLDTISQTADNHVGTWEVRPEVCMITMELGIAGVSCDTLALSAMIHGIAEGIDATNFGKAGIHTGLGFRIAEAIICTLFVRCTLGCFNGLTLAQWS